MGVNQLLHFLWKLMRRNVGILQWEQTETKCDLQDCYLQALICIDWVSICDQVGIRPYAFLRDALAVECAGSHLIIGCTGVQESSKVKRLDVSCAVRERAAYASTTTPFFWQNEVTFAY